MAKSINVAQGLHLLANPSISREQDLQEFNDTRDQSIADEETDSPAPILDKISNEGGREIIIILSNFDMNGFKNIGSQLQENVTKNYNTGRKKPFHSV